jgi:small subunit ribosomal protein S20
VANHKSAIKRVRQNRKRNERNRQQRSKMRTLIKNVETALAEQNSEKAQTDLAAAIRILDKSASKGLIHKNKAARKKSALTRHLNRLAAQA